MAIFESMSPDVVDLDAALHRLGGNAGLLGTLVQYVFEDAPGLLEQARGAAAKSDAGAVRLASHKLSGLLSNFDARRAVAAAVELEQLATLRDWPAVAAAIATLDQEITRVLDALGPHRPSGAI